MFFDPLTFKPIPQRIQNIAKTYYGFYVFLCFPFPDLKNRWIYIMLLDHVTILQSCPNHLSEFLPETEAILVQAVNSRLHGRDSTANIN